MRRTKADAEQTRQTILDAAEWAFFTNGVAATTLEDIARKAGVTRGAIYWHFASKADLFLSMLEDNPFMQNDLLERCGSGSLDALDGLEQAALSAIEALARDEKRQRIYRILLRCEYQGDFMLVLDRQKEAVARLHEQYVTIFETAEGQAGLQTPWTARNAARVFDYTITGMLIEWIGFGQQFDLVEVGGEATRSLFRSFRPL